VPARTGRDTRMVPEPCTEPPGPLSTAYIDKEARLKIHFTERTDSHSGAARDTE
jgi:hypothetical protein